MSVELKPEYLQSLSQSEYEVLEYIYKHKNEVLNMSIKELSSSTFFSTATIMRLCKKLKLSGFSELKYMLRREMKTTSQKELETYPVEEMSEIFCNDLHETCGLLHPSNVQKLVEYLLSDKRIHFFAKGITMSTLKYFSKYLLSCNRANICYEDTHIAYLATQQMNENDIVIVASKSGSTTQVIKLVQMAKARNAIVIAFVGIGKTPLSALADVNFYISNTSILTTKCNYDMASRAPFILLFDIIINQYLQKKLAD